MSYRPAGSYILTYKDGGETTAATASLALTHWSVSHLVRDVPNPLQIVDTNCLKISGPYEPNFFVSIIGHIERLFGTSPEIEPEFFNRDWYSDLPEHLNDHKMVVKARRDSNPKVVAYEGACLKILSWLTEHGDIVHLDLPM